MPVSLPFDPMSIKLWLFVNLVLAMFSNITSVFGYNIGTWIILLWATYNKQDIEGMFVALMFILFSILLDIIVLSLYADGWSNAGHSSIKFSLAMNIIGLLLKPFVVYIVHKEFQLRGGDVATYLPFLRPANKGGYQSIDQPPNYAGFSGNQAPPQPAQPDISAPLNPQQGSYQQIPTGYPVNPAPGGGAPPLQQKPPIAPAPVDPNAAPF